jgi:Ni,Fe-hydrogenase I small subunit
MDGGGDQSFEDGLTKYKYWCKGECEQNLPASKLLIVHDYDWCGDIDTFCFGCSGWEGTEKSFMKAARNAWIKRTKRLRDKSEKLRLLTWETLEVYKKLPGSSKKKLRTIIVTHLKVIARSIASDIVRQRARAGGLQDGLRHVAYHDRDAGGEPL